MPRCIDLSSRSTHTHTGLAWFEVAGRFKRRQPLAPLLKLLSKLQQLWEGG